MRARRDIAWNLGFRAEGLFNSPNPQTLNPKPQTLNPSSISGRFALSASDFRLLRLQLVPKRNEAPGIPNEL